MFVYIRFLSRISISVQVKGLVSFVFLFLKSFSCNVMNNFQHNCKTAFLLYNFCFQFSSNALYEQLIKASEMFTCKFCNYCHLVNLKCIHCNMTLYIQVTLIATPPLPPHTHKTLESTEEFALLQHFLFFLKH